MVYELAKISEPVFTLTTEHKEHLINVLGLYVCDSCKISEADIDPGSYDSVDAYDEALKEATWPSNYDKLSEDDKLNALMMTYCGAEFHIQEYENWEDYYEAAVTGYE